MQNAHRSRSAPHPLTSLTATVSNDPSGSSTIQPTLPSSPHDDEAHDAFHLEGFFPRTNSYYSLSTVPDSKQGHWVNGGSRGLTTTTTTIQTHELSPTASSFTTSQPITPAVSSAIDAAHPHLILSPTANDNELQITREDRVSGIASAAAKVVMIPLTSTTTYDHEHLIHSYDSLHNTLSERRRSATAPDLTALNAKNRRNLYDASGAPVRKPPIGARQISSSTLFSPVEEKVDYWAMADEEEGVDGAEQSILDAGGALATYIYEGAKRLWVRKPTLTSDPAPGSVQSLSSS